MYCNNKIIEYWNISVLLFNYLVVRNKRLSDQMKKRNILRWLNKQTTT